MNGNKSLKDEILNSVDDNLIADNSSKIKSVYFLNQKEKEIKKKNGFKWGLIGTSLTAAVVCAIAIPIALNQPITGGGETNEIPKAVSNQSKDISFGVSSIAEVLSSKFSDEQNIAKASILKRHGGEPEPEEFWSGGEQDSTNYLVTVEEMYSLTTPYLSTINNLLNGTEFPYQIEDNENEEYPFKIGNFIFNVVENEDEEGEVQENNEEETQETEIVDDRPDFSIITEFYDITGQLIVDDIVYPVTGQQITFGRKSDFDDAQYSELYLNANKDETHEVTIFKSTYTYSFSNSFKEDATLNKEYSQEAYAYIETELSKETIGEKEFTNRKIVNAVQIVSENANKTINDELQKKNSEVYLSLESSYEDEDGIENTINADMCFRLPNDNVDKNPHSFTRLNTNEAETNTNDIAFRVDYECRVVADTPFEKEEEFGHGQHRENEMKPAVRKMNGKYNNFTTVFGSFYIYKDEEGNLLDPDFATEGRHQVIRNGGYNIDWYDNWDW